MLPGRDGFEICRELKFRRETNLIPIVMLTAMQGKEAETSGLRVGANRYLTKPFEPDDLLQRDPLARSTTAASWSRAARTRRSRSR